MIQNFDEFWLRYTHFVGKYVLRICFDSFFFQKTKMKSAFTDKITFQFFWNLFIFTARQDGGVGVPNSIQSLSLDQINHVVSNPFPRRLPEMRFKLNFIFCLSFLQHWHMYLEVKLHSLPLLYFEFQKTFSS